MIELGGGNIEGAYYARKGTCEWWFGWLDKAIQTYNMIIDACEDAGTQEAGLMYMSLQWVHMWKGNYKQVIMLKDDVDRMLGQEFNPRIYVMFLAATSMAYTCIGQWDHAVEEGKKRTPDC